MKIILYQPNYIPEDSFDDFLDSFHQSKMKNLASELLSEGYAPEEIAKAIRTALSVCQAAGMNPRHHFHPVYTQYQGTLVKDCKLSDLGYGLVMLNGPANRQATAAFQIQLLKEFLDN